MSDPHTDRVPPDDVAPGAGMPVHGTAALRSALQAVVRLGAHDEEVRRALVLFSAEGRRRGLLPEQVLVLLKEAWGSLPEIRAERPALRDPRLEWLTSETIRAYYAAARPSPGAAPEAGRPEAR